MVRINKRMAPRRAWSPLPIGLGYGFLASVFALAATHAPFLSAPPFASHFILALAQSFWLVGAVCANAAGANAIVPATAAIMRSFMLVPPCLMQTTDDGPVPATT